MRLLLIDIGNTTCDVRAFDPTSGAIEPLIRLYSRKNLLDNPKLLYLEMAAINEQFKAIIYVSVVPELNDMIRHLGQELGITVLNMRNDIPFDKSPFKTDDLRVLGADFIANYFGFKDRYRTDNAAIVSLGSATTIFLIKEGKFIGTTISPGVLFSLEALLQNTSLLEKNNYRFIPDIIGTNTFESISIGAIKGHFYLIMGLLNDIKKEYSLDKILFTGGNAYFYHDVCQKHDIGIDETLIFHGLSFLALQHTNLY